MSRIAVEPVTGQYIRTRLGGQDHRVYVERSGSGTPLVCLHTAGADTRQYRAVQNDPEILSRYEVICFDLPFHGKSSPPAGWHTEDYRLPADDYVAIVLDMCDALELEAPVLMGCSIGGRLVVEMAIAHSERFSGLIGLQSGAHVPPYYDTEWLDRPDVHGGRACAAVVSGLVGPGASDADRHETLWHYMQSGPGVFKGDLFFYNHDKRADLRDRISDSGPVACPLYFLTGEYDYSCSPADTRELAASFPGSTMTIMPGIGHFPMSEAPDRFLGYLRPVLAEIAQTAGGITHDNS